jgi:hypothetical protein
MLSLPPHTTHKLQPLDRAIMKPLKNAFIEACAQWMHEYLYLKIRVKDIAGLVIIVFTKICRMELAKSAFACTGICTLNRGIFSDLNFLLLAGLDFSDAQHAGTAFPDAKGDCTPFFDPELFPATVGSESLPSPKNLPVTSTSQCTLQTLTMQFASVRQSIN